MRERTTDHAIRRARERYGLELTPQDLGLLARNIRRGDPRGAVLVAVQREDDGAAPRVVTRGGEVYEVGGHPTTIEVWRVNAWGTWALCVYDAATRRVVTFLDPRTVLRADGSQDWDANLAAGIEREVA